MSSAALSDEAFERRKRAAQPRQASEADRERVIDCLSAAFATDPVMSWIGRRDAKRDVGRRAMFTFLVGTLHEPGRIGAWIYSILLFVFAAAGAALATRQVWLQALPKDQVPACGMGLSYMLDTLPFIDVLRRVLEGSGECAEKGWVFLGLSIAGWTLAFFFTIAVAGFALARRD